MSDYTAVLFARPSFIEGVARTLDLGDTLTEFNTAPTPQQANGMAIAADWAAVGETIQNVMDNFAAEHGLAH
jgi:hypothetical protein